MRLNAGNVKLKTRQTKQKKKEKEKRKKNFLKSNFKEDRREADSMSTE
jgi:hypothetical protein